jgi:hypothetical protein
MKYVSKGNNKKQITNLWMDSIRTFDLLHIDIYGPFNIKSIGEAKYVITFINYKSMMMWIKTFRN